jgi:hypothetical protein
MTKNHLIFYLLLIGFSFIIGCQQVSNNSNNKPVTMETHKLKENKYNDLRKQVFGLTSDKLGLKSNGKNPFLVVLDIGYDSVTMTLITIIDGNASIYLSSGGGVIGGFKHDNVKNTAIRLVNESSEYISKMTLTTDFSVPMTGNAKLYAMTDNGVYFFEDKISNFESDKSELSKLYLLGHYAITEFRKISENK